MTALATRSEAQLLEEAFLGGLEDMQNAYERIVETEAWLSLGFDSFAGWWQQRVMPTMRALSMRPTREIAAAVVDKVREEEAELPPAQRRTQRELADMVGVGKDTVGRLLGTRSAPDASAPQPDLEHQPVAMPARQDDADAIVAAIDEVMQAAPRKAEPVSPQTQAVLDEVYRRVGPVNSITTGCELLLAQVHGIDPVSAIANAPSHMRGDLEIARDALEFLTCVVNALKPIGVPA